MLYALKGFTRDTAGDAWQAGEVVEGRFVVLQCLPSGFMQRMKLAPIQATLQGMLVRVTRL
ncbi:hypothetical protein D3C71_2168000 [compost metagenome]